MSLISHETSAVTMDKVLLAMSSILSQCAVEADRALEEVENGLRVKRIVVGRPTIRREDMPMLVLVGQGFSIIPHTIPNGMLYTYQAELFGMLEHPDPVVRHMATAAFASALCSAINHFRDFYNHGPVTLQWHNKLPIEGTVRLDDVVYSDRSAKGLVIGAFRAVWRADAYVSESRNVG